MQGPQSATTSATPDERVQLDERPLNSAIQVAVDDCTELVERNPGTPEEQYGARKKAVLAVADALLDRFGMQPAPESPAPSGALRHAKEVIASFPDAEADEAATLLALEFEMAVGDRGRQDQGVVYTPPDVVHFMVREALAAKTAVTLCVSPELARAAIDGQPELLSSLDRQRLVSLLEKLRVVDPAVGAGAFMVGAARGISSFAQLLAGVGAQVPTSLLTPAKALQQCCHGFEVDPDATRLANAVLALSCRDVDSPRVPDLVTTRNTLIGGLSHSSAPSGWDIVLMNPPYIGEKQLRMRLGEDFQAALRTRDGFAGDLLSHFLLRAIEGTSPGGVVSAIVSDTTFTMSSAEPVRARILRDTTLFSLAWCRPFPTVAAQGGVVTTVNATPHRDGTVACYHVDRGHPLDQARSRVARRSTYTSIPGQPLFRPSGIAARVAKRWAEIDQLEYLWEAVAARRRPEQLDQVAVNAKPGDWTLLGVAVRAGQGLATGDDRRFVGLVAHTEAARRALEQQRRILGVLRTDPSRANEWRAVKKRLARGDQPDQALMAALDLRDEGLAEDLPGRKPFRIVPAEMVRRTTLDSEERQNGIQSGPTWVPYETGDRSGSTGGRRWIRDNPVVVDWSDGSVALLRRRKRTGPRSPVLRHEELWFKGGITHNRVTSYLRARILAEQAIFSSESPCYVPCAPWLNDMSLLALLNSPVLEFFLKTFLATRNHIELGHVRRLPIPVPSQQQDELLTLLGGQAVITARAGGKGLAEIEGEIDTVTRDLYGIPARTRLPISR